MKSNERLSYNLNWSLTGIALLSQLAGESIIMYIDSNNKIAKYLVDFGEAGLILGLSGVIATYVLSPRKISKKLDTSLENRVE